MTGVVLPVLLMVAFASAMAVAMLVVAKIFGPRRGGAVKQMPYESGMDPIHDTRRRFDVRFYMVAIAFLIFDVELLFLYPWAVARTNPVGLVPSIRSEVIGTGAAADFTNALAAGDPQLQSHIAADVAERTWIVFGGVMVFLVVLVLGYIYDWKKGLFQWR